MIRQLFKTARFSDIYEMKHPFLYAGDIPDMTEYNKAEMLGLSIKQRNKRHIKHDITKPYPIEDNAIEAYQAEDVFEHIEYDYLVDVINEIYRILKPGGYFRLSVPDYRCDVYKERTIKDLDGNFVFDPMGGGAYKNGRVIRGGHVWFPTYEKVMDLITKSKFTKWNFYHYYDEQGISVTNKIDYSKGHVMRTPDFDSRVQNPYRAMSIVVDLFK